MLRQGAPFHVQLQGNSPGGTWMGASAQHVPDAARSSVPERRWKTDAGIGFRFVFLYFLLYCLTMQIITGLLPIPFLDLAEPGSLAPLRAIPRFARPVA